MNDLTQNPLQKFYRAAQIYVTLPSGKNFYKSDILELTENGEVGVLPLTARDELLLTSPDGLLNGESLSEVLKSCVKGLKNPKGLIINDIEVLMVAINYATYGKNTEMELICPSCSHKNTFSADLQSILNTVKTLNPPFPVNFQNGLTVMVRPYSYSETMKALSMSLEQSKLKRIVDDNLASEESKLHQFGELFKKVTNLNMELMINCVYRVVKESDGIDVQDRQFISEFMQNISTEDAKKIDEEITRINTITYDNKVHATCQKCKHEWDATLNLNPVNFSTAS